MVKTKL